MDVTTLSGIMSLMPWWVWLADGLILALGVLAVGLLKLRKRKRMAELRGRGESADAVVSAIREFEARLTLALTSTIWQATSLILAVLFVLLATILGSTFTLLKAIVALR